MRIAINERVKELLQEDSSLVFDKIEFQHMHRHGGIEEVPFMDLLKEIAEADLRDVDLI